MNARRALLVVLTILALAVSTLCCWLALTPPTSGENVLPTIDDKGAYRAGSLPDPTDQAALAAAAGALVPILSYHYRHLDADIAAATKLMTPTFGAQFRSTFEKTAAALAPRQHAVTTALVRGVALVQRTGDTAICLVFVDQLRVTGGTGAAQPTLIPSRVQITMKRDHNHWLVAGIDPF